MAIQEAKRAVVRATEVHRNFGDLLKRVFSGREHLIIERDGLPVAVMLPVAEYENLMELAREEQEKAEREEDRQRRLKQFQQAAREIGEEFERLGITEEQMMELLEESKQQVYDEFYGASKKD